MSQMNRSLSGVVKSCVADEVSARRRNTPTEYVRELIHMDPDRPPLRSLLLGIRGVHQAGR